MSGAVKIGIGILLWCVALAVLLLSQILVRIRKKENRE